MTGQFLYSYIIHAPFFSDFMSVLTSWNAGKITFIRRYTTRHVSTVEPLEKYERRKHTSEEKKLLLSQRHLFRM